MPQRLRGHSAGGVSISWFCRAVELRTHRFALVLGGPSFECRATDVDVGIGMVLRNGIYKVLYNYSTAPEAPIAEALAVLREGKIFGADRHGAVFMGSVGERTPDGTEVCLNLTVPPFGEPVTGFVAGPEGAQMAVQARLHPGPMPQTACLRIADAAFPIRLCYVGPLPD